MVKYVHFGQVIIDNFVEYFGSEFVDIMNLHGIIHVLTTLAYSEKNCNPGVLGAVIAARY